MYEGFYSLKENPFRLTPDPAYVYMTAQHQEALSGLIYTVCTRPGLTVLMGEAGTGKTTLLYSLLSLLERRRFLTAMCTNPTLTRPEFYDLLMMRFQIDCSSSLKSRQLAALEETLQRCRANGTPCILIVDEAQRLTPELLEEIRLLLNMETPQEKLLQIILAGQPELGQILARPELRQFKQRVNCVCKLNPLSVDELKEYLHHRLAQAGLTQQALFSDTVIQVVFEYTQGIPRLVNSVCDGSLRIGFALQSPRITTSIVEEAANDLDLTRFSPVEDLLANVRHGRIATGPEIAPDFPSPAHSDAPNGRSGGEFRANRQKGVSFFAGLMDHWK